MAAHHCTAAVDTTFVSLGYAKVAVLGVVQGITELVPVSSSAHMRAVPAFLGWPDPGAAFSATMQWAALAAVVTYFWSDIAGVSRATVSGLVHRNWKDRDFRLGIYIIVATIPGGLAGLALSKVLNACDSPLRTPLLVGAASIVVALIMGLAELIASHKRGAEGLTLWDSIIVGLAQAFALIPGVSRSGAAFSGAMFLGFNREDAARVSFLLGIPFIFLAGAKEIFELHKAGLTSHGWSVLAFGLVVSSLSAFVAVWGLMRFLRHSTTWPLVIYRAAFGGLLVWGASSGWIS
ncbi:MAG TPA: undecaprenyl-diphosphate phosphatase [Rhizomicrobium sp.]|nr:undecaprenyl-diphosphate phosphatase [Rhizomicrobium sp.]